jgi:hypothetical protein
MPASSYADWQSGHWVKMRDGWIDIHLKNTKEPFWGQGTPKMVLFRFLQTNE